MSRSPAAAIATCLVLATALLARPGSAVEPWDEPFAAPAATLLEAARALPDRGADSSLVLLEEGRYTFDETGRITRSYRLVYRITSQDGIADWGRVETGFAPRHQARPALKARVISPSGVEHWLDPATIDDTPASDDPDLYDDQRMLRAPLPQLGIGAVVEHETTTRDETALFDAASMGIFYFGQSQPAHVLRLILDAPAGLPLRVSVRGLDGLVPTRTESGGRIRLVYEKRDATAWEFNEPLLPPETLRWPHVSFTTGRSWNAVATRYAELVEHAVDAAAVAEMTKKAVGDETDRRRIVAACVAALQKKLRYAGIEFGVSAIVPVAPTLSLQRGYGDCKDQAAFLVSMLRSLGIPATLALLEPGPGPDVDEDVPGVGDFGHAITYVPGDPPLWVDTTDPYTPVGELPDLDQGRLALIISPTTTGLTRTPLATSKDNRAEELIEIRLAESGPASVRERTEAWGTLAVEYRANHAGATAAELEGTLRSYAKEVYLADRVENIEASQGSKLEPSYRIAFTAPNARRGFTDARQAAFAFVTMGTYARISTIMAMTDPTDPEDEDAPIPSADSTMPAKIKTARTADWMLPEAFSWERRYHVMPPPGFQLRSAPEAITKQLGPAKFTSLVSTEADGSVTVVHRLDTVVQRFTDSEWQALRKGLDELSDAKPDVVVFDSVGELHLAEGRIREALAQFRVLAALHPREALHHLQISRALLAGGLGDAARAEAERAVVVEPSLSIAHRILAFTREHDALGRRFGGGSDSAAAIRHLRRALELEPTDGVARAELAYLLERDSDGDLLWSGAQLAQSIAEYRKLRELTPKDAEDAKDDALLGALVRSRDWAGALTLAEEMPQDDSRDAAMLVCVAASEGAAAALARSLKPPFEARRRGEILRTAAARLTQARLYPEAVALFEEAAKGTVGVADLHESINLFRRVNRFEKVLLPADDPGSVVQLMEVAAINGGPTEQMALLAPELWDSAAEREAITEDFTSSRSARGGRGGLAPEFRLDLTLSTEQLAKDGDDANGWRIRVRRSGEAGGHSDDVYVIRLAGAWKIAATASQPQHLGRQALNRLEAGDLAGARRWLDWAREHLKAGDADDPVWPDVFPRAWRKGQDATEAQVRVAAATLVARTGDAARALPILRAAREAATSPEQALDLDMAMLSSLLLRAREDSSDADRAEFLRLARSIVAAQPTSPRAFAVLVEALGRAHRWGELEAETRRRIDGDPTDSELERTLADTLILMGKVTEPQAIYQALLDRGEGRASDANMLAWLALFTQGPLEKAMEDAQRAVRMSKGESPAYLHTLASVLAEAGNATAAREIILRTLNAANREEPEPSDWYVLGRIAEEYGERAAALDAYRKVRLTAEDADAPQISCHFLAQRRIAGLETPAGRPAQAR